VTQDGQGKAREDIWRIVQGFNQACVRGAGFEQLASSVDEDVVFMLPGLSGRLEGREKLLGMYAEACSAMKMEEMSESDAQVEFFGGTAVVCYKYHCVWESRGRRNTQDGHEILVFTKRGVAWRLSWRTILPGRRETEVGGAFESGAEAGVQPKRPVSGLRAECLALMTDTRACCLSTIDADGFPETTGMDNLRNAERFPSLVPLFAEHEDDFVTYLSTGMLSQKVGRIRANSASSVYFCDPDGVLGLMLIGRVEVVEDQDLKDRIWQKGWTIYYPSGPEGPEYGILRFRPHLARGFGRGGPFEFRLPLTVKDSI
jgi:general stress protein 26/ketosteroid isomerase-like protein